MDAERWREIRAVFSELVELKPDHRAERLTALGAVDPELRKAVEPLLAADTEKSGGLGGAALLRRDPPARDQLLDPFGLVGHTLSHFRVLESLGCGGMGVVYRAEDTRLGRPVALKLPLPHQSLHPSAKARFLQEARSAASLDHPNVCNVHEVGESDDGRLFLAMALYPGETLKARLAREDSLPIEVALAISEQVARGLACAHAAGIVHRDLKPGNLMLLPDGTVKILDFGLAKVRDLSLTGSGERLGTVVYMAPEQIRGEAVDGRADLWALGVVLYEMLTGRRPFEGEDEISIAHAVVDREPIRPSELRGDLRAEVEDLILSLLEKDPRKRFSDAGELLAALVAAGAVGGASPHRRGLLSRPGGSPRARPLSRPRRTVVSLVGITAGALVGIALTTREVLRNTVAEVPLEPSLAVLPFDDLSADERDDYLAVGLHDEILNRLAGISDLRVSSRTSVLGYADADKSLRQIAGELGVGSILEGSVQRVGERVRVNVQLIDATTDKDLWAARYDRALTDLLEIQSEIAQAIAVALRTEPTLAERVSFERPPTQNARAYDLYLRAREYQLRTIEENDLRAAESLYRRALELDPSFALAHAQLSSVHVSLYFLNFDRSSARREQARIAAEVALRLQPDLPESHLSMGIFWYFGHRDYSRALEAFEAALKHRPKDADVHMWIALVHRRQGRWNAAVEGLERAAELDPRSRIIRGALPETYFVLSRYVEAIQALEQVIEIAPDNYGAVGSKGTYFFRWQGTTDSLAAALSRIPPDWDPNGQGTKFRVDLARLRRRPAEALAVIETSRNPIIRGTEVYIPMSLLRAQVHEELGDTVRAQADYQAARVLLEDTVAEYPDDPRVHAALGYAYAGLGRRQPAIREARRAMELLPPSRDAFDGPAFMRQAAVIFARVGEVDTALELAERLLNMPRGLSVHQLRLHPSWDPLRSHPRFQTLIGSAR